MLDLEGVWNDPWKQVTVRFNVPQTTREVLPMEGLVLLALSPRWREGKKRYRAQDVRRAMAWVGRYTEATGVLQDMHPVALMDLALTVYKSASVPREVLEDVARIAGIVADGGCECRMCKGTLPREKARSVDLELCRYNGTHEDAQGVMYLAAPLLDSDIMSAPFWVYQVKRAIQEGKSKYHLEQVRKRNLRNEIDRILGLDR